MNRQQTLGGIDAGSEFLADVVIYLTGDEIGTYTSVSTNGNSNGIQVQLSGVEPLGTSTDVFRVVVRQVNSGGEVFNNGQFVDIYAWPESDPPAGPIYSNLNPQHDQFQGRASSAEHQIFTSPANIVFDLNGITAGSMSYGPGFDPPRAQQLSFDSFSSDPPAFPCFAAGTLIETDTGPLPVDVLTPGDLVRTLDHGLQPLRWTGKRTMSGAGPLAPVRIAAGALGNYRDLYVSQQHRFLMRGWQAEIHFGQPEVLIAAKHLINENTIRLMPRRMITYVHLAFEHHEVIFAEGIATESLHLGAMAIGVLDPQARGELLMIFPELAAQQWHRETARPCLKGWERLLVA